MINIPNICASIPDTFHFDSGREMKASSALHFLAENKNPTPAVIRLKFQVYMNLSNPRSLVNFSRIKGILYDLDKEFPSL